MLSNYLKIAFRNLLRNNIYSIINILGLTMGLTGACLLFMFINYELNYDAHLHEPHKIARLITVGEEDGETRLIGRNPAPLGEVLRDEFSNVEAVTTIFQPFGHLDIHWKGETFSERSWFLVDSSFFDVYRIPFIQGDATTVLDQKNSIVLTESLAKKYFPNENPIGQVMEFERLEPMTVTGVVHDQPANTNLQYDVVISSNATIEQYPFWQRMVSDWRVLSGNTIIKMKDEADIMELETQIASLYESRRPEETEYQIRLQPNNEIHLNSANIEYARTSTPGSWDIIYLFAAVAIFLLVMAIINYVNLATSKSMQRAKEIGTRKVSGATRTQLVVQFLSEAMLLAVVSFVLSVIAVDTLLPFFNQFTNVQLGGELGSTLAMLFTLTLIVGLVAGFYPAFYLSSLQPSESLKGIRVSGPGSKGVLLRKVLVILQFSLSIFMICSTLIITNQMQFLKDKDLGFKKDNVLVIDINDANVRNNFEAMKVDFAKIDGVNAVASSSRVPGEWKGISEIYLKQYENQSDSTSSFFMCYDEDMLSVYELELVNGRNFRGNLAEDSTKVLINEAAAKVLGKNPIGAQIAIDGYEQPFEVIGVMKNFNYQSLHNEIAPLVVGYWSNPVTSIDYFSLKVASDADMNRVLADADVVHKTYDKSTAMEFHFIDQQLELFYLGEQQAFIVFRIGALLTIVIACMGLFGMASFIVQRRTKEIGVRKVLGATKISLFILLSKTFVLQVLVAFAIATPFAWMVMGDWLNEFAYAVDMSMVQYILAGFIAVLVALISVSYRVIKSTSVNPAVTLKSE